VICGIYANLYIIVIVWYLCKIIHHCDRVAFIYISLW